MNEIGSASRPTEPAVQRRTRRSKKPQVYERRASTMPQPTMPYVTLDNDQHASSLKKEQSRVTMESIEANDQETITNIVTPAVDRTHTAATKELEMLNGEKVLKLSTKDTHQENNTGAVNIGGHDRPAIEAKTISGDTNDQDYLHVLYPGGGNFNKLRKKQSFLQSLLENCVAGYLTEGPRGKRKFVSEHILDKIPGGLHVYCKETGEIYKPDETDAFYRVSQRLRDIKKYRLNATKKAKSGHSGGLKRPGGRGSKCFVKRNLGYVASIWLPSFLGSCNSTYLFLIFRVIR